MRLAAAICCVMTAAYAAPPVAAAVDVASAIQRRDAAALADRIDWSTLRPFLSEALLARTQLANATPLPAFIANMAADTAAQLASPEGLAILLGERLASRYDIPGREMLSSFRVLGTDLWEFVLAAPDAPQRTVRLTLAPMDPLWLRWKVRSIELPTRSTVPTSVPMS